MSKARKRWVFKAVAKRPVKLTFWQDRQKTTPVDLTGAVVYFTAKRQFDDAEEDAIIDLKVTSHTDAENGITHLPIDLTGLDDFYFEKGATLVADIVLKDSLENVNEQETFDFVIDPSVTRETE